MKNFLKYGFLSLILACSITACSDKDDEPSGDESIVGSWQNVTDLATEMGVTNYLRFESNGDYYEINIFEPDEDDPEGWSYTLEGHWVKNGNSLTVSGDEIIGVTSTIKTLTDKKLVLTTMGMTMEYKKVADSVVDEYL